MVVSFPPDVSRRLAEIEAAEGVPALEIVHQAVDVWTRMTSSERRIVGIAAMQMIVGRIRDGGAR